MTENLKNFLKKVSGDEELREKLTGMQTKEEVIAFAGELGFELTEEDMTPPEGAENEGAMNERELAAVAGGVAEGGCACMLAGGGGGTNGNTGSTFACACVAAGVGDDGEDDGTANMNCICAVGGAGSYEC